MILKLSFFPCLFHSFNWFLCISHSDTCSTAWNLRRRLILFVGLFWFLVHFVVYFRLESALFHLNLLIHLFELICESVKSLLVLLSFDKKFIFNFICPRILKIFTSSTSSYWRFFSYTRFTPNWFKSHFCLAILHLKLWKMWI